MAFANLTHFLDVSPKPGPALNIPAHEIQGRPLRPGAYRGTGRLKAVRTERAARPAPPPARIRGIRNVT